jgi:hypothetical protein
LGVFFGGGKGQMAIPGTRNQYYRTLHSANGNARPKSKQAVVCTLYEAGQRMDKPAHRINSLLGLRYTIMDKRTHIGTLRPVEFP